MSKRNSAFPYRLLRIQLPVFALLLIAAIVFAVRYPALCLSLGKSAIERGDEARAVSNLEKSDTEEARALLSDLRERRINRLLDAGSFEEALEALREASVTDPSDDRVAACLYGIAGERMRAGDYAGARETYASVLRYRDAVELKRRCEHELAFAAFRSGDPDTALLYARLDPENEEMKQLQTEIRLKEAKDLLASDPEKGLKLLLRLWQDGEDVEAELLAAQRLCYPSLYADTDDATLLEELKETDRTRLKEKDRRLGIVRELPEGVLALGNAHTVLLKEDGTVLACGDNRFGQCDVGGWTNVVAVASGAYHTLGLCADGTVLSCGNNEYGQCDTTGISGAVEIAAHGFDTAVRCGDGSVICLGAHAYDMPENRTGISALCLGGYALLELRTDGTVFSTAPSFVTDDFRSLIALDAASTYAVGITEDGRIVTSAASGPDWENIVAVSASAAGIMGLTEDHTVRFWLREPGDYEAITVRSDAVAIAFSGRHAAALLEDGTLLVCGENDLGQCGLSGAHR